MSLEVLRERIQKYEPQHRERRNLENQVAMVERQLVLAAKRDELALGRPEGCWCLGLGGDERLWDRAYYFNKSCSCAEGIKAEEEKRVVLAEADRLGANERIQVLWRSAHIPEKFMNYRLQTWPSASQYPELMEKLSVGGGSWFFFGPYGTGKTGLAVGLAREQTTVKSLLFATVPRMLGELRDTYNHSQHQGTPTEQQVLSKFAGVALLVLDDLGAEQVKDTGWVEDRLYQVIGERHDEARPTIFTSNLSLQQLGKRIGERVTWRITEMVGKDHIINMTGMPNLRA